jgi:hypothetical protein
MAYEIILDSGSLEEELTVCGGDDIALRIQKYSGCKIWVALAYLRDRTLKTPERSPLTTKVAQP